MFDITTQSVLQTKDLQGISSMRAKWNLLRTDNISSSSVTETNNSMGQLAHHPTHAQEPNQADLHGTHPSSTAQLAAVPEQLNAAHSTSAPGSQVTAASEAGVHLTSAQTSAQIENPHGSTQTSLDTNSRAMALDLSRTFTSLSSPSAVLVPSPVMYSIPVPHGLGLPKESLDMHAPFVANPLFVSQPLLGQSQQPKQAMPLDKHPPDRFDAISRPPDAVMTSTTLLTDTRKHSLKGLLLSPGSLHSSSGFDFGADGQIRDSFAVAAAPRACNLPPNMLDPDFIIPECDSTSAKLQLSMYELSLPLTQPNIPEPSVASAAQQSVPHWLQISNQVGLEQPASSVPNQERHASEAQPASCSRASTGNPDVVQLHDSTDLTRHSQQHKPQPQHSTVGGIGGLGQGSLAHSNVSQQFAQSRQTGPHGSTVHHGTPVHRVRTQQMPHNFRTQQPEQLQEPGETFSTAEQGLQAVLAASTPMQSLAAPQLESESSRAERGLQEVPHSVPLQSLTVHRHLEHQHNTAEQGLQGVSHCTQMQSLTAGQPESQLSRGLQQVWNSMALTPLPLPSTASPLHASQELNTMPATTALESQLAAQHAEPCNVALSPVASSMTHTASSLVGSQHPKFTPDYICQDCRTSNAVTSNAACSSHIGQDSRQSKAAVCSNHKYTDKTAAAAAAVATPAAKATNFVGGGLSQLRTESCASRAGVSGEAMSKIARQCPDCTALLCSTSDALRVCTVLTTWQHPVVPIL